MVQYEKKTYVLTTSVLLVTDICSLHYNVSAPIKSVGLKKLILLIVYSNKSNHSLKKPCLVLETVFYRNMNKPFRFRNILLRFFIINE